MDIYATYSWKTWFKSMTLPELKKLRERWLRNWRYYKGHELDIMTWNKEQLDKVIENR